MMLEGEEAASVQIFEGRLHGGHTAFIATSKGLVCWKFLMDSNALKSSTEFSQTLQANDYDLQRVYSSNLKAILTDTQAVFFAPENGEFTLIDFRSFTKKYQV